MQIILRYGNYPQIILILQIICKLKAVWYASIAMHTKLLLILGIALIHDLVRQYLGDDVIILYFFSLFLKKMLFF